MSIRPLIRAARPRPRPYIVAVGNHWRVTDDGNMRAVTVREPDGTLTTRYVPDEHPALARFLDRAAVAA